MRLTAFRVPTRAAAGEYLLTYSVSRREEPGSLAATTMKVVVRASDKISLTLLERPEAVIAGNDYQLKLQVVNQGNTARRVKVTVLARPAYPLTLSPTATEPASGEARIYTLTVRTPQRLAKAINQALEIRVQSLDGATPGVLAQDSPSIALLPASGIAVDLIHRVPSTLRFLATTEERRNGYQLELAGAGALDEKRTALIEYLFRTPGTQQVSSFGLIDEYRASYLSGPLGLWVGDRGYDLSPLTQRSRYGRGIEAAIRRGNFDLGMYVLETRFQDPRAQEAAVHVGYQLNPALYFKGNTLRKALSSVGPSQRIFSLESVVRPQRGPRVDVEVAGSVNEQRTQVADNAYRFNVEGTAWKFVSFRQACVGSRRALEWARPDDDNGADVRQRCMMGA